MREHSSFSPLCERGRNLQTYSNKELLFVIYVFRKESTIIWTFSMLKNLNVSHSFSFMKVVYLLCPMMTSLITLRSQKRMIRQILLSVGSIYQTNMERQVICRWSLRKKCPYLELFLSVFSCIRTEYGEIRSKIWKNTGKYIRENTDQNIPNSDTFHAVDSSVNE